MPERSGDVKVCILDTFVKINVLPRFERQTEVNQSACADKDTLLFQLAIWSNSSESFPFGEFLLTEGARLIIHEWERKMFQIHGLHHTFMRPNISG